MSLNKTLGVQLTCTFNYNVIDAEKRYSSSHLRSSRKYNSDVNGNNRVQKERRQTGQKLYDWNQLSRAFSKLSRGLVTSEGVYSGSGRSAVRGMKKLANEWMCPPPPTVSVPLTYSTISRKVLKVVWRIEPIWLGGLCVGSANATPVHSVSAPESPSRPSVAGATPVTSSTSSTPTSVVTEPSTGLRPSASLPSYSLFPSFAERWVKRWE